MSEIKTPAQYLCQHALRTLPDSVIRRRAILRGIRELLPREDETRVEAGLLLFRLEAMETQVREIASRRQPLPAAKLEHQERK